MELDKQILSDITVYMKYARHIHQEERRETWQELVDRNMDMHIKKHPVLKDEIEQLYKDFVLTKKVLPSMRSLQFGGKAIEVNNSRVYNCAYMPVDSIHAFSETMFLLLGGTGVGYSVQNKHIDKLPEIKKPHHDKKKRYVIQDSIMGWADAVKVLMKAYTGKTSHTPVFDFSDIREKGALLITAGGKAPGPEPLKIALIKIEAILKNKEDGSKLTDIECHDIQCHIADAVLAGGIRRAAMISLFDLDSDVMLMAKGNFEITSYQHCSVSASVNAHGEPIKTIVEHIDSKSGDKYYDLEVAVNIPHYGERKTTVYWVSEKDIENLLKPQSKLPWYYFEPQRGRANNSAVILRHKINKAEFKKLWQKIEDSGFGEPGMYLTNDNDWGTNPCCEIALRPNQFCNLTEINMGDNPSQEEFEARARAAAFLGTLQASYTDFHYLRDIWRKNTEKDALLGVSMTGIASVENMNLDYARGAEVVKEENRRVAAIIGINPAARTTAVKPAGTTSLVLGTSSGIHAWHNDYYIRRIRLGKNESIYTYLSIYHPQLIEDEYFSPDTQAVVSVPQKAPAGAFTRHENVMDLLERVKHISQNWVKTGHIKGENTHNVSCTVSIRDGEWPAVGEWMWENRDAYNGLSVLPMDGGTYMQLPFEDITEERYNELVQTLPSVDLSRIVEVNDTTNLGDQAACAGGACEVK